MRRKWHMPGHDWRGSSSIRGKSCLIARRAARIGRHERPRRLHQTRANARPSAVDDRRDRCGAIRRRAGPARAARDTGQLLRSRLQWLRGEGYYAALLFWRDDAARLLAARTERPISDEQLEQRRLVGQAGLLEAPRASGRPEGILGDCRNCRQSCPEFLRCESLLRVLHDGLVEQSAAAVRLDFTVSGAFCMRSALSAASMLFRHDEGRLGPSRSGWRARRSAGRRFARA